MRRTQGGSSRNGYRAELKFVGNLAKRSVWGGGNGWFSASFGPFRRFTGGDREMDKLFEAFPRLAAHLSAFGENVALGESLRWLTNLQFKNLDGDEEAAEMVHAVCSFIGRQWTTAARRTHRALDFRTDRNSGWLRR